MPRPTPPSFGSQEYWNERFTSNTDPFEWLEAPNALDKYIVEALQKSNEQKPQLLHIGCGTSLMSYHLRSHVQTPTLIHNIDYSEVAIDLGRERERQLYERHHAGPRGFNSETRYMSWHTVDLLDHKSLLRACQRSAYSVILDKSTSDAISCADDIDVPLPYPIAVRSYRPIDLDSRQVSDPVHLLYIVAVNLALVAKCGARWIALSYSDDRFPFLAASHSSGVTEDMLPDPGKLWKLVEKREVEMASERDDAHESGMVTHRPKICNWVYILERTEVPLLLRGDHI
jgi:hypothetical protein